MATVDVTQFKENGFVMARAFFQKEEVERVRSDAKNIFLTQLLRHGILKSDDPSEAEFEAGLFAYFKLYLREFINCGKQIQHLVSLHRLSLDPRIEQVPGDSLAVMEVLGYRNFRFWRDPRVPYQSYVVIE